MSRQETLTALLLDSSFRAWALSGGQENRSYWERWMLTHPEYAEILDEAREILLEWQADKVQLPEARKEVLRQKILSIAQSDRSSSGRNHPSAERSLIRIWAKIAAAVVLLLAGGVLLYQEGGSRPEELRYSTTYGEIKTITLPDSSIVTLNGNSSIRYLQQAEQGPTAREVWLAGEAFFDVSKRQAPGGDGHPQAIKFIVHTENLSVQVLGTRFNVRHRRDQTQVVLEEGSVQLQLEEQASPLQMSPDEMVEVHKGEKQINQKPVKANDYTGWKDGLIHFNGASFAEINQVLEDNYNLTLHFEHREQAGAINLKGAFPADNIDILLEAVANVTHTTIHKEGNMIMYQ